MRSWRGRELEAGGLWELTESRSAEELKSVKRWRALKAGERTVEEWRTWERRVVEQIPEDREIIKRMQSIKYLYSWDIIWHCIQFKSNNTNCSNVKTTNNCGTKLLFILIFVFVFLVIFTECEVKYLPKLTINAFTFYPWHQIMLR